MDKSTAVSKLALYLSWVVGLILVLLPFHAFLTVWLASLMGHYTLLRLWKEFLVIVLLAGVAYLLAKNVKLRKDFFASRIVQLIIIYCLVSVVWGAVSYGLDKVTLKALGYGLIVNLRFLTFFLITWVVATKSQWLRRTWPKLLLVPAAIVIIVGLLQRLVLPYDFLRHFGYNSNTIYPYETINNNVHYPRIMSTLRGANPLGAYLVLILSTVMVLLTRNSKRRWLFGAFGLAGLLALIFSYSRAAWAGLILSLLFLVWAGLKNKKTKRLILIGITILLAIAAISAITLRNNQTFENIFFHTQNHSTAKISSNEGHISALRSGVRDVLREPLGRGLGTAGPASLYNDNRGRIAENYFVQIAQETGWLGLILFATIYYLAAKELWKRRSDPLDLILLASLVGLTFINLLSHAWADDTIAYLWWGLAGVALAPRLAKNKKAQAL